MRSGPSSSLPIKEMCLLPPDALAQAGISAGRVQLRVLGPSAPKQEAIRKRGGLLHTDAPPHALRHTAASLAVSAGANVKAVQRMLGHASAAMTLDVYADLFDDDLDSVADRLDEGLTRSNVAQLWATEPVRNSPR
ncbi:MAG: hypothetical protein QOE37_1548 [Microbacteriaceae bacterium]|nr:hypothetical protein [Microbacteriaceae bacterium]